MLSAAASGALAPPQRIGIIGGGFAGLACARRLQELGLDCVVYDTGKRAPGGRASSRQWGSANQCVDHAAQFAAVTSDSFGDFVSSLERSGVARRWGSDGQLGVLGTDGFEPITDNVVRVVGECGMCSLVEAASEGLDIRQDIWVAPSGGIRLEQDGRWRVAETRTRAAHFDAVVIAHNGKCAERLSSQQPARAVHALLRTKFAAGLRERPKPGQGVFTLCSIYSLLVEVPADVLPAEFDAAFVRNEPRLRFLSNNAAKLGARAAPSHVWTALSSPEFGAKHKHPQEQLEGSDVEKEVTAQMISAVEAATGLSPGVLARAASRTKLQLWGAALPLNCWTEDFVWAAEHRVGIAGDWLSSEPQRAATLEAAWLSGVGLAEQIARRSESEAGLALGEQGGRFRPVASGFTCAPKGPSEGEWVSPPAAAGERPARARAASPKRRGSPQRAGGSSLFVRNLPYSTSEAEISAFFSDAGDVSAARLLKDRESGRPRGLAVVRMGSAEAAKRAIASLDGGLLGGREVRVSLDERSN